MGQVIRITKEFSFEAAHALAGYDGLCSQVHGHSYRLFVTVKGEADQNPDSPKLGMVMDFSVLKAVVNRNVTDKYDHSLMVRRTAANAGFVETLKGEFDRIIVTDFQPTCENLIVRIAGDISAELPAGITLHSVRLHETATSFAEWFAEDNF